MYLKSFTENNITYSIDMLRLKTYLTFSEFSEIEFRFQTIWNKYVKKFYNSFTYAGFKYNYNIEIEEGKSFWFGFLPNCENASQGTSKKYNFTIEFNPNKLKDDKILMFLLNFSGEWYLKSFDLACDIPISILDLCGFDKGRKRDIRIISSGFDNKTVYIGKSQNRIKIYNKKLESDLDIAGEMTRIEVSHQEEDYNLQKIAYYSSKIEFPELFTNDYMYSFKDYEDKTLLAILYAVQSGFELSMLTRRYKDKIKKLLEGNHKIRLKSKHGDDILRQVIYFYFVNNLSFHFK